jgi:FkbM family methyltransferase
LQFMQQFLTDFFVNIHKIEKDNWDYVRFPETHPGRQNFMIDRAVNWMQALMNHKEQFEQAYNLLADEQSRQLMLKILQYDILDHHHVKLPLNTEQYWPSYNSVDTKYLVEKDAIKLNKWAFNLYELPYLNLKLYSNPLGVLTIYMLKQYFFQGAANIQPEAGDICIDAGGCWGDVALHFARTIGAQGSVHSFEFVPNNIAIFEKNVQLNPDLANIINIVPKALYNKSGEELTFDDRGPSTSILQNSTSITKAETITIDDYVKEKQLKQVDFIKMDIEGAEVPALAGAVETIRRFHPKLAICVYHKQDDFFKIPFLIRDIDPGYSFYLGHYTIHREETVLYAKYKK